jgi:hypothetical protein
VLSGYIKSAIALNDAGVTVARASKRTVPASVRVPADLAACVQKKYARRNWKIHETMNGRASVVRHRMC